MAEAQEAVQDEQKQGLGALEQAIQDEAKNALSIAVREWWNDIAEDTAKLMEKMDMRNSEHTYNWRLKQTPDCATPGSDYMLELLALLVERCPQISNMTISENHRRKQVCDGFRPHPFHPRAPLQVYVQQTAGEWEKLFLEKLTAEAVKCVLDGKGIQGLQGAMEARMVKYLESLEEDSGRGRGDSRARGRHPHAEPLAHPQPSLLTAEGAHT